MKVSRRQVIKSLIGLALGAAPGVIWYASAGVTQAIVIACLGAFIGLALTLPGVSASRVAMGTVGVIAAKNAPIGMRQEILNATMGNHDTPADSAGPPPIRDPQAFWNDDRVFQVRAFVILAALAGPAALIFQIVQLRPAALSAEWPAVDGVIQSSFVATVRDKESMTDRYQMNVMAGYKVEGQDYFTDRVSFSGSPIRRHPEEARQDMERYATDSPVAVFYNPAQPGDAVLEPGVPEHMLALLGVTGIFTLVAWLAAVVGGVLWIRERRVRRAPDEGETSQLA